MLLLAALLITVPTLITSSTPPSSRGAEGLRFPWGSVEFYVPSRMAVGSTERIETRITSSVSTEALRIRAILEGATFAIAPLTTHDQGIPHNESRQWAWIATPMQRGDTNLELRLTQMGPRRMVNETRLTKKVAVAGNTSHLVRNYWQWALGTLLAAVAASALSAILINR